METPWAGPSVALVPSQFCGDVPCKDISLVARPPQLTGEHIRLLGCLTEVSLRVLGHFLGKCPFLIGIMLLSF